MSEGQSSQGAVIDSCSPQVKGLSFEAKGRSNQGTVIDRCLLRVNEFNYEGDG